MSVLSSSAVAVCGRNARPGRPGCALWSTEGQKVGNDRAQENEGVNTTQWCGEYYSAVPAESQLVQINGGLEMGAYVCPSGFTERVGRYWFY